MFFVRVVTHQSLTSFPYTLCMSVKSNLFSLLYLDLWIAFKVACTNDKYFLSIVGDFSWFTWLFLLQSKDQTTIVFECFKKMVEKKFNLPIKLLQEDGGTEFKTLSYILELEGIVHMLTSLYTSA